MSKRTAEDTDLAASVRTGAEWIAGALADLGEAMPTAWRGEGLSEIAAALTRMAAAQERQAAALERLVGVMEKRR